MLHELLTYLVPCLLINIACGAIYPFKKFQFFRRIDPPLDGGHTLGDGQRLLGDSTTRLGLPVALLAGLIIAFGIGREPVMGIINGLTVFGGHALGSFIKRRFHYSRGQFMPIVDHGDFIITTGVVFGLLHWERWPIVLLAIIITLIVTPPWNYVMYRLGLHRDPL